VGDTRPLGLAAYRVLGGHPALDLVNTVGWRGTDRPDELLRSVDELEEWLDLVQLPLPGLGRAAPGAPRWDEASLDAVRAARESLHRVLRPVAVGADPSVEDLDDLAARYVAALAAGRPVLEDGRLRWHWPDAAPATVLVNEVLVQGVELLDGESVHRVKLCTDSTCGWLFLDRSKNGSRRWCSMDVCGSRTKMRRHYRRKKELAEG
jgi:predicted RNA-binding Zn ribbon-like protein